VKKSVVGFLVALTTSLFGDSYSDFIKAQNSSFERFNSSREKDFNQFKKNLEDDFNNYQKILNRELKAYKREIYSIWGDREISTPKKWVEYSKDKKTRKIVDFEKNEIRVEIVSKQPPKVAEKILFREAVKTLSETEREAVSRDELTKRVEKKFERVAKTPVVKTEIKNNRPILQAIFDRIPSISQLVKFVKNNKTQTEVKKPKIHGSKIYSTTIKLPKYFPLKKAREFKRYVDKYAKRYHLETALIYAIIHSESSFNPLSTSNIPAYGLMQIVPRSAGLDAYQMVYHKKRLLSAQYLYVPRNNIELGSAYLHILYYRYFKSIKNPESRLYCAIAGYNTGAGNVARAFVGKSVRKNRIKKASKIINNLSPDEVYSHLRRYLPYDETRRYVKKVTKRLRIYRKLNL